MTFGLHHKPKEGEFLAKLMAISKMKITGRIGQTKGAREFLGGSIYGAKMVNVLHYFYLLQEVLRGFCINA